MYGKALIKQQYLRSPVSNFKNTNRKMDPANKKELPNNKGLSKSPVPSAGKGHEKSVTEELSEEIPEVPLGTLLRFETKV